MTTSEKIAYLKGLYDGLAIDKESPDGKLFSLVIDILGDLSSDIEDLEENALDLSEELDEISDDLAEIEDIFFDDDEDDDDDECCDGCCGGHDHDMIYEAKCEGCGNVVTFGEDVLELGSMPCPNCGEQLEFIIDNLDLEDFEDDD